MADGFWTLYDWLGNCGLDEELREGLTDCTSECPSDDCDECGRWEILDEVADQICEHMMALGKQIAAEWLKAQDEDNGEP